MDLTFTSEQAPLMKDEHGIVFVANTRVPLDSIVYTFREGLTAEEIVHEFSTLKLADVYAVITYYLQRREEVDAYISERERHRAELRKEVETRFNPEGLRARLLAR
ncbi:MAG: DUF433 domain-containing protein [Anaerolineae bacterium]|nr:DUF433 domain-containing protein [Anaerolineae bacterium]